MSALLAFTTVGVLLPFFFYNVFGNADRGRKIFMGDTGSLTLGYILSFLAVQYTMNTYEAGINYEGAILISFSVLLVPCLDVVRVVLGRVRRGKDPFMPDKTHIHHKFLAMGFTPRKAMISILCISFLFCASNVFLVSYLNNTVLFLCDVAVWTLMNLYISKLISRRKYFPNMIVPSFRLYHFAVKLIWKRMLVFTLLFWLGVAGVYYVVNETPVWQEYGWWLLMMVGGTYFLLMDVKLMLMIMRHEEKKKMEAVSVKKTNSKNEVHEGNKTLFYQSVSVYSTNSNGPNKLWHDRIDESSYCRHAA